MIINVIFILTGLVLLFLGGEGLVKGSVNLAQRLGLSALLVSLVVIGFGTSVPELLVCVKAALSGVPDMAVGNAIGSNIANTFLILGVSAVILPLLCEKKTILRDSIAVIVATLILAIIVYTGIITWVAGLIMLAALFGYLGYSYFSEMRMNAVARQENEDHKNNTISATPTNETDSALKSLGILLVSLVMLIIGADVLVRGASNIARSFGVSEVVIGLSLVAIGTSLPELATAIIASLKKQGEVIIGNVLGSNLFNILGILGVTSLISPLPISPRVATIDIWILLCSALVLYPVIFTGYKISRREGFAFLICYGTYITMMYV